MGRKLANTIFVTELTPANPAEPDGMQCVVRTVRFLRGEELPDWAVPLIRDLDFVLEPDESHDESPSETSDLATAEPETPATQQDSDSVPLDQPRGNASVSAWRKYAIRSGVSEEVAAGMSRDELREHLGTHNN